MSVDSEEYAPAGAVVRIRLYDEDGAWTLDGIDASGNHTEACWTFDTEAEARATIAEFCEAHRIPSSAVRP